jgi:phenylacetate-CoA ligase
MTRAGVALEVFDPIERASTDELRALQLRRLRETLHHAHDCVEHYQRAFKAAAVHPSDLVALEDLRHFPFLLKQHFRDSYPTGLLAVPRERLARIHASSGTTGKPTIVGYTAQDLDTWAALVARSIYAAGGRPGDTVHVAYGYGLFTGGLGAHYGAERLGCAVIPMSGGQTEKQVVMIRDLRPDLIMVTPSYMLALADEFARQGMDPASTSLRAGLFGAEPWSDRLRNQIEVQFGIDALDIYGLSEVMGPGVASECVESKDGPVLWEDHFYPEIIDPQTGEVLEDGEEGELVLTSLTKEALPIVRYRTRDRTRLLPPTTRAMRRLGRVVGRTDDMLIIRGVNVFPSQLEELILRSPTLSPHYVLEVTREGPLDALTINVEVREGVTVDNGLRSTLARDLMIAVKDCVGVTAKVTVHPPDSIARSQGKASRVLDHRG